MGVAIPETQAMSNPVKNVAYVVVLTLVCSTAMAWVSARCRPKYLKSKAQACETPEMMRRTLSVLPVATPASASPEQICDAYRARVTAKMDAAGEIIAYECRDPQSAELQAVAFPVQGPGHHGQIKAMLALEKDLKTIRCFRVFENQETDGLGADIAEDWFQDQFAGKTATDEKGEVAIRVVEPDTADGPLQLDGISGATITSKAVDDLLRKGIKTFLERYKTNGQ